MRLQTEWEVLEKRSNMSPAVLSSESYALPSPGWYALCCDMRGPREREGQVAPRTRDIQHGESLCTYQYVAVVPRFSQRREVALLAYPNTIMRVSYMDLGENPFHPGTSVNKAVLASHYAAWGSTASLALATSCDVSQRYHDDEHPSEPHRSQAYATTRRG